MVERRRLDAERLMLDARANSARLVQRLWASARPTGFPLRDTLESLVDVESAEPRGTDVVPERRPDLRIAEADVRVADASLDRAHRDGRFDVALRYYTRMRTMFPATGSWCGRRSACRRYVSLPAMGATLTLPWRNDNRGEIAAAEARAAV